MNGAPAGGTRLRTWLAGADAAPARWARLGLRSAMRARARMRSGSVSAEMDRIVADAHDTSIGSGLDAGLRAARRRRRAAQAATR